MESGQADGRGLLVTGGNAAGAVEEADDALAGREVLPADAAVGRSLSPLKCSVPDR